jgi:hypothetical protein
MAKAIGSVLKDVATLVVIGATWAFSGPAAALKTFALSVAARALAPKPPAFDSAGLQGRDVLINSPLANQRLIYGTARVGGILLYAEVNNSDQDLHLIIGLCSNKTSSIYMQIADVDITSTAAHGYNTLGNAGTATDGTNYGSNLQVIFMDGDESQTLNTTISTNTALTSTDRFRGISYVYVKMVYNTTLFPNGIPQFQFRVTSSTVPFFTGETAESPTTPAVGIFHYLTNTRYGMGFSESELDKDSFIKTKYQDGLNGFLANGVIDLGGTPNDVLGDLLSANASFLTYTNGKFKLLPYENQTGLESQLVSKQIADDLITPDNIVDRISLSTEVPSDSKFNTAQAVYIEPDRGYQLYESPVLVYSPWLAEDNGITNQVQLSLPLTIDDLKAQKLAYIEMANSRRKLRLSLTVDLKGCFVDVGDRLQLDLTSIGFPSSVQYFEVVSWELTPSTDGTVVTLGLLGGSRYVNNIDDLPYEEIT